MAYKLLKIALFTLILKLINPSINNINNYHWFE